MCFAAAPGGLQMVFDADDDGRLRITVSAEAEAPSPRGHADGLPVTQPGPSSSPSAGGWRATTHTLAWMSCCRGADEVRHWLVRVLPRYMSSQMAESVNVSMTSSARWCSMHSSPVKRR